MEALTAAIRIGRATLIRDSLRFIGALQSFVGTMMFKCKASPNPSELREMSELRAKVAAIYRSQAVIEFDLDGFVTSVNDNFLKAVGYVEDETIGKHHSMFVTDAYGRSVDYREFWARLKAGDFIAGKFLRLAKGGREIWIEANYNPILDSDGVPYKVVKFATDITEDITRSTDHAGQVSAIGRSQAVISFSPEGAVLSANENFLSVMGYTDSEIVGRHHRIFVDPTFASGPEYQTFWSRLRKGEFLAGEYRRLGKGGREVWIQASYNPIFDLAGRLLKIVKYATDTTELKKKSADDAGQLEAISRSQAVISFDLEGFIVDANENFLSTVGYRRDEVIGLHHSLFVTDEFAKSAEYQEFWRKLKAGEYHSGEFQRVGKDSQEIWLQASYNPIFDASGRLTKVVKYATDITSEVAQRAQFSLLSLVADETDNSVVITDRDQRIIYVNGGFERLTGYQLKEVLGKVPGRLLQGANTDKGAVARIRKNLHNGEPFYEEVLNYSKDGKPYWISLAINPVRNAAGRIDRFISIQANITETKLKSLDFTTKLEAIGASNAMAEWDMRGDPLTCNPILSTGAFTTHLHALLDEAARARILREGRLRKEISMPRSSDEPLWLDALFTTLNDLEGRPSRILMCGGDVGSRRAAVDASVMAMSNMMGRITNIVESIGTFSRQTNLLALNAAIEAARAQDVGRGFALIAKEIRKLSVEASVAITQIDDLLQEGRDQIEAMSVADKTSHMSKAA